MKVAKHFASRFGSIALISNAIFLIANTVINSALGFLFWLLAARIYTPAEVGLGSALITSVTLLAAIADLGLGTTTIQFAAKMGKERAGFINAALGIIGLSSLLIAIIFALSTQHWSPNLAVILSSRIVFTAFVSTTIAFSVSQYLDRVFIAFEVTHFVFIRNIIAGAGRVALLIMLGPYWGSKGMLAAVGIAAISTLLLSLLIFVPKHISEYRVWTLFSWNLLKEKIGFTLGSHIATLLWNTPTLVYPLLIVAIRSPEENAQFYLSWMIANLLYIIPTSVFTSLIARVANTACLKTANFRKTMWLTMLGLIVPALVLIAIAPRLLGFFGGVYGRDDRWLFGLLILCVFPYTVNTTYSVYLRVHQQTGRVICYSTLISMVSLLLSAVLGAHYALIGIGLGWLLGQLIGTGAATVGYWQSFAELRMSSETK
jgi:O-antigen/teichoic acid export membrane protein